MLWVTRPHPHIDRTACAWLVRRFVDPEARFAFAPDPEVARELGGTPYDMRGVELLGREVLPLLRPAGSAAADR